jgi:hypothetical protein
VGAGKGGWRPPPPPPPPQGPTEVTPGPSPGPRRAVRIFPSADEDTGEPTPAWTLFSGDSAAPLALLAIPFLSLRARHL